jgi:diaminopimelate epimerase
VYSQVQARWGTRSCGTGTVAAVVAALRAAGETTGDVAVQTPGGRLRVTVTDDTTVLHGPAVLVASGELDADWWASLSRGNEDDLIGIRETP